MADSPIMSAPASDRPWGAKGTTGPVFAGRMDFESVDFAVGDKTILSDVSLTLEAGKIACLLGPSGCGKSTLLRLAAGVARPTGGRILLDGVEVASSHRFVPPERRNVGLMFQDFALFPHMTALQNVAYGLYALDKTEANKVALLALERVGLLDKAKAFPGSMSGGEQQRVALARAIVPRPQVIMMDEPFSGLDQRLRDSVRAETMALVRETRATCLLVTHDPHEAMMVADQIFLMRAGRIVQQGQPESFLNQPANVDVARFFREYNEFSGRIVDARLETAFGPIIASGFADGSEVVALVSPGDFAMDVVGKGAEATVIDNRNMGDYRQISLRIVATGQKVTLQSHDGPNPAITASCGLVLRHQNAHIFMI